MLASTSTETAAAPIRTNRLIIAMSAAAYTVIALAALSELAFGAFSRLLTNGSAATEITTVGPISLPNITWLMLIELVIAGIGISSASRCFRSGKLTVYEWLGALCLAIGLCAIPAGVIAGLFRFLF